jgi:hypothetical protein
MTDYLWHGDPAAIAGAVFDSATDPVTHLAIQQPKPGLSLIGPRVLDGVAWVSIRTDATLTPPSGVTASGPETSLAILGTWAADPA